MYAASESRKAVKGAVGFRVKGAHLNGTYQVQNCAFGPKVGRFDIPQESASPLQVSVPLSVLDT